MNNDAFGVLLCCGTCLVPFGIGFAVAWNLRSPVQREVQPGKPSWERLVPNRIRIAINEWMVK